LNNPIPFILEKPLAGQLFYHLGYRRGLHIEGPGQVIDSYLPFPPAEAVDHFQVIFHAGAQVIPGELGQRVSPKGVKFFPVVFLHNKITTS
jgi:hypothetical protein